MPNTEYWDKARVPKQDRLVLIPMPEASTRTAALLSGEVNWIEAPSPDAIERLKSAGMQIVTKIYPHNWSYQLNFVKGPFTDKRVRQAANYALNRADMKDLLNGLMLEETATVHAVGRLLRSPEDLQLRSRQGQGAAERGQLPAVQGQVRDLDLRLGADAAAADERTGEIAARRGRVRGDARHDGLERAAASSAREGVDEHPDINAINISRAMQDPFNALIRHVWTGAWAPKGANWGHFSNPEIDKLVERHPRRVRHDKAAGAADQAERGDERGGGTDLCRARPQPARPVAKGPRLRAGAELVPGFDAGQRLAMIFYILRRILYAIPIAFGVSVVCFSLVYIAPGDPLQTVMPPDATAETIEIVKHAYGFDKPMPVQYLIWLGHVVTGDFGMSISTRRPVILEVTDALSNTALLALFAVPIVVHLGYAMGVVAGCFPGRWLDRVVTGTAVIGVSLPNYWLGIVLVIVFAVEYALLPATGMGPSGSTDFHILEWSSAKYLVLPVITLSMIPIGILARTTRAAVAEVRNQDFVQTLRAKGLSEWAVTRHVLKNSLPQVMAVMGLQFGYLLGGSILVETVFTWPGSGFLLSKAIINRDVPVLQGTILTLSLVFVATNLVVDLLQSLIDPRIRRA